MLLAEGKLLYREEILEGIESARGAVEKLYDGSNPGRLAMRL
jgi:NADPH-dependent curcumin reductase CurA